MNVQRFIDTVTPLGAAGTFTGTARNVGSLEANPATTFRATAIANVASAATNGFRIEHSVDGTTWYTAAQTALAVSVPSTLTTPVVANYYRVVVVNGAGAQASFLVASSFADN